MYFYRKYMLICLMLSPFLVYGSCSGTRFTITEILNKDNEDHHIFSCEIIATYLENYNTISIAVVKERYKGNPKDTIYINTGGSTMAGGKKLYLGEKWLIFSPTDDNLNYRATVCDRLSSLLSIGDNKKCTRAPSGFGELYTDILEQYDEIKRSKYNGYKKIEKEDRLVAEGFFKDGLPDSDWIHYSRMGGFKKRVVKSKITYECGNFNGNYIVYNEDEDNNSVIEKREYNSNLIIRNESVYEKSISEYEYLDSRKRIIRTRITDTTERIVKKYMRIEFDYQNDDYPSITVNDGYYYNILSRDSSYYSPLGKGSYFRGARTGEWEFYNKNGEIIKRIMYPDTFSEKSIFLLYDDSNRVRIKGTYSSSNRVGIWTYYYDGQIERTWCYNSRGEKVYSTRHYTTGGVEITPYENNIIHGKRTVIRDNKTIARIESFVNGQLHGRSIIYDENSSIEQEKEYRYSRAYSTKSGENGYYIDGFLNGYVTKYRDNGYDKRSEGQYWNGYKKGVWIEYEKDGSYKKMYYLEDENELMNECFNQSFPYLTESYDKDGKLVNSWKF